MKSQKELNLEEKLRKMIEKLCALPEINDDLPLRIVDSLINDEEIQAIQDYANVVAIKRLGYNDHGPVHMRQTCYNAVKMLKILFESGIKTSLETEGAGTISDSFCAVLLASFMHDFGMTLADCRRMRHGKRTGSNPAGNQQRSKTGRHPPVFRGQH